MEATSARQDAAPGAGRRERKKQRTRDALIGAAFALFEEKGFEATTVEEIADAVDVSSRTFFRYFASKEDVALTFQEEQFQAVLTAFAARPADEPVITALHRALVSVVRACEIGDLGLDPARFRCLMDLTAKSTQMLAGSLQHAQQKQVEMTRAVAERMGADTDEDLRPHIVAAAAGGTFRAATDIVGTCTVGERSLSEIIDRAFTILEEGLNYPSKGH